MMSRGKSSVMACLKTLPRRQKSSPEFWIEAGVDQDGFEKKFISRLKEISNSASDSCEDLCHIAQKRKKIASDSGEDLCHIAQRRKKIDPIRKWSDIEKVSMQPLVVTAVRG